MKAEFKYMEKYRIINWLLLDSLKLNSHKCASDCMNKNDAVELVVKYGASIETIESVRVLFGQGDSRYENFFNCAIVAGFLDNKAVVIEEKSAPESISSVKLDENDLIFAIEPQREDKIEAIKLLKSLGLDLEGAEIRFRGGVVDVLGRSKDKTIAIECGPCRVSKVVDYLECEDTELWLIQVDFWQTRKFFVVSRGPNWKNFFDFHSKTEIENTKKAMEGVKF